jgi:hypothetical protein
MTDFLLTLHSILRWVILAAALAAMIRFALGWRRGGQFSQVDNGLAAGFSGLMDLQVLLGLVYLLWTGLASEGFSAARIQHSVTMIFAAVAAHLPSRWKKETDTVRYRNSLFAVLGAVVIILAGLAPLARR